MKGLKGVGPKNKDHICADDLIFIHDCSQRRKTRWSLGGVMHGQWLWRRGK